MNFGIFLVIGHNYVDLKKLPSHDISLLMLNNIAQMKMDLVIKRGI